MNITISISEEFKHRLNSFKQIIHKYITLNISEWSTTVQIIAIEIVVLIISSCVTKHLKKRLSEYGVYSKVYSIGLAIISMALAFMMFRLGAIVDILLSLVAIIIIEQAMIHAVKQKYIFEHRQVNYNIVNTIKDNNNIEEEKVIHNGYEQLNSNEITNFDDDTENYWR